MRRALGSAMSFRSASERAPEAKVEQASWRVVIRLFKAG
jgi:hypothetical protein